MIRFFLIVCALLSIAACDRPPEYYPPPEQRHPIAGNNPGRDSMMVEMSDPEVSAHFVKDIYPQSDPSWRWTGQNPTLQLLLLFTDNLKFNADFALWEDGFKVTGPIDVSYWVNGRFLDKVHYTSPGDKHFEKPVPPDWLSTDSETTVAMSCDKLYVSPKNGIKFGLILVRIGFKE